MPPVSMASLTMRLLSRRRAAARAPRRPRRAPRPAPPRPAPASRSSITSGGTSQSISPLNSRITTPRSRIAALTVLASDVAVPSPPQTSSASAPAGSLSRTNHIRPSPKTLRTDGCRPGSACSERPSVSPRRAARSTRPSRATTRSVAEMAATASGWPRKVLDVIQRRPAISSTTRRERISAPAGAAPPVMPLPIVTRSGRAAARWKANERPIRPSAVTVSSAMKSAPASAAAAASASW